MIDFKKPQLKHESDPKTPFHARFIVEPLERGFGATLGNTMRRVLLSSLPGAAVTSIKVEGTSHEFSAIKGVREDLSEVILNIKEIIFRADPAESHVAQIEAKGGKEIYAKDIKCPEGVEVVNGDTYICTLADDGKLNMEMTVETGRGYLPADKNKKTDDPIGVISVDSIFTPIKRVSFKVENTRVGQITDYDKLTLDVETNGSMTPEEAVSIASKIVMEHMRLFEEQADIIMESVFEVEVPEEAPEEGTNVETLGLSVRAVNCLLKAGIHTLEQLKELSENDLLSIKNFGSGTLTEIKERLEEMGTSLKSN